MTELTLSLNYTKLNDNYIPNVRQVGLFWSVGYILLVADETIDLGIRDKSSMA